MDESTGGVPFTMPVAPAYGGGYGGSGFGSGFGGDWAWILLLLVLFGGWGNGGMGGYGMDGFYPWMNQSNQINGGFRDQMINDNITGIRSDLGDISTQLCNGFNQVGMNILQSVNGIQSQLSTCCCENRLATVQTQNVIATESAATRANATANTQAILDKLCQLELDAKNDTIAQLRSQINELSRTASQNAQTAAILANNEAQTAALEKYLAPTPIPAYIVANPNCCQSNCGCGV